MFKPQPFAKHTELFEFHPCISKNGNTLIFISLNRLDGIGGLDLYISFYKNNGSWTKPIYMGDKVHIGHASNCGRITSDGKHFLFNG